MNKKELLLQRHLEILQKQDLKTLAAWWCRFNCLEEWIPELGERPTVEIHNYRWEIMGWIMEKITFKECLREWNKERMTIDQFEAWWKYRDMEDHLAVSRVN